MLYIVFVFILGIHAKICPNNFQFFISDRICSVLFQTFVIRDSSTECYVVLHMLFKLQQFEISTFAAN